jgi:hypothetical protein
MMTLSITILSIKTLSIAILSIKTLSITAVQIIQLNLMILKKTHNNTQNNTTHDPALLTLNTDTQHNKKNQNCTKICAEYYNLGHDADCCGTLLKTEPGPIDLPPPPFLGECLSKLDCYLSVLACLSDSLGLKIFMFRLYKKCYLSCTKTAEKTT